MRYCRVGELDQVRAVGESAVGLAVPVMRKRLFGSSGLVSARNSSVLLNPSPSLSPAPFSKPRLGANCSSQASGMPSPSVSGPQYIESVWTWANWLLREIQPALALQISPLRRPVSKSTLGPSYVAPLASWLVKVSQPMFAPYA